MKILVDTNILISALIWRNSKPAQALLNASAHHEVILCEQNLTEFRRISETKFKKYEPDIDLFLASFHFEVIPAIYDASFIMRDAGDQPILNSAMVNGVDVIITGDKDFLSLEIEHPKCVTAAQYLDCFA